VRFIFRKSLPVLELHYNLQPATAVTKPPTLGPSLPLSTQRRCSTANNKMVLYCALWLDEDVKKLMVSGKGGGGVEADQIASPRKWVVGRGGGEV